MEAGRILVFAHDFMRSHLAGEFTLSVTALGEFAAGFAYKTDQVFLAIKSRFRLRPMDETDAWHYREIVRFLKGRGELIGANDLWRGEHNVAVDS
jgi:predicted nucleic acid-binding protein